MTVTRERLTLARMRLVAVCLLVSALVPSLSQAQGVPVFAINPAQSSIKFNVKASVAIGGTFDQWNATLTFASTDVTTGVLDVEIQAASVDTGSGMKDSKLKSSDFFDVANNFHGCIAGCHEILRRQGLMRGIWCLDPTEGLSPGQLQEIDRVCNEHADLADDDFVAARLQKWLA